MALKPRNRSGQSCRRRTSFCFPDKLQQPNCWSERKQTDIDLNCLRNLLTPKCCSQLSPGSSISHCPFKEVSSFMPRRTVTELRSRPLSARLHPVGSELPWSRVNSSFAPRSSERNL